MVGRAAARGARRRGRGAARPLPRVRRVLGDPGGEPGREHGRWVEAPGRELFAALTGALAAAICRSSPKTWASSRRTWTRCATSSACPACACCSSRSAATRTTRTCRTSTRDTSCLHRHPRQRHRRGWFEHRSGETAPRASAERALCLRYLGTDGAEIHWDFIRAARCRWPRRSRRSRTPRPRFRRPHEHARPRGGQLVLAAPARGAHRGASRPAAREHGDLRAPAVALRVGETHPYLARDALCWDAQYVTLAQEQPVVVPQVTHVAPKFQQFSGVNMCAILPDPSRRILCHVRLQGQENADRKRTRRPPESSASPPRGFLIEL